MLSLTPYLSEVKIGEPRFIRNLVLYPLSNGGSATDKIEVLERALKAGTVKISEAPTAQVERIKFENRSDSRVFLLDGEELTGALQDRITNTAALIEGHSEVLVPVSCVEEGRWHGDRGFGSAESVSYPSLRAMLCRSVTSSLKREKRWSSDQKTVWAEMRRKISSLRVQSVTSSMRDVYKTVDGEINRYTEDFEALQGFSGLVALSGSKILCLDFFENPALFQKLIKRLLASYALDALERTQEASAPQDREVTKFLNRVKKAPVRRFPSIGLGNEFRFEGTNVFGRALVFDDQLLHVAAFATK
jgi:hypothetical protein